MANDCSHELRHTYVCRLKALIPLDRPLSFISIRDKLLIRHGPWATAGKIPESLLELPHCGRKDMFDPLTMSTAALASSTGRSVMSVAARMLSSRPLPSLHQ